ncbi:MAG: class I SAM-dependent methyltransferase [Chloroflexota bacterium]|nr:class I SAM-dependent methyltransferase [Chloroflexota bacterium]
MPTSERVKAYFDEVAQDWDTMRQAYYGVEVIDKVALAAGLAQGTPGSEDASDTPQIVTGSRSCRLLIDVGCGTGFLSSGLAGMAERVIGVDESPAMLAVAEQNLRALNLSNVQLRQGSVDDLPLALNSADVVVSNMVLHHAPDPQHMVQEMARVVQPGGRVVISDMDSHTNEWFRVEMADVWLGFTEPQARHYMESAGLVDIEFGWVGTQ